MQCMILTWNQDLLTQYTTPYFIADLCNPKNCICTVSKLKIAFGGKDWEEKGMRLWSLMMTPEGLSSAETYYLILTIALWWGLGLRFCVSHLLIWIWLSKGTYARYELQAHWILKLVLDRNLRSDRSQIRYSFHYTSLCIAGRSECRGRDD